MAALCGAHASAADLIVGEALCDGRPIGRIAFDGNRVTRPEVMARELILAPGDACTLDEVIGGFRPLEDLGLFRSVRAQLELGPNGELVLRYAVREKFFFIGVPRLSRTTDGELRAGVSLEWDNFLGRLHELELLSEWRREDDGRGHRSFVNRLSYQVPRLLGSDYGVGIALRADRRGVDFERDGIVHGRGRREEHAIGLGLSRWLSGVGTQGTRAFVGLGAERRTLTVEDGRSGPAEEGLDFNVRAGFERRRVHLDRFRRTGTRYGASFGLANEALGSDFTWHRLDAWGARYMALGGGLRNLNVRASVGLSDRAPFGERFYAVGGGDVLRGVNKGTRDGDVRVIVNAELLSAFASRPTIRWVLFADVGNAWPRDEVDLGSLDGGAGVGLRWKLRAISDTDLRLDLAWDHAEARVRPYLSTKLTF